MPRCLIIAGPNGAGKTTFARTFLPRDAILRFVNADLLAAGLSPLNPDGAQIAAGRLFLSELDRLSAAREDFAFESTLSGLTYLARLRRWRTQGYRIEIIYLKLNDVRLSLERVAARVRSGGHDVPEPDVRRRFSRSSINFETHYHHSPTGLGYLTRAVPRPFCSLRNHENDGLKNEICASRRAHS